MEKLKILLTASEVVPFAKTGGLADVTGALPRALEQLGHEVIVAMPRYYGIDCSRLEHIPGPLGVSMGPMGELWAGVYRSTMPNSSVPVYFIDHEAFYGRSGLYADESGRGYSDNDNRFVFLSKAALQLCKKIGFRPDIIHAHDWHTAAQPVLRNTCFMSDDTFAGSATVLTIHNLQHQGLFYEGVIDVMEVDWKHFNPFELEAVKGVNLLKGGIAHADAITTVSRKYAQEIQTPEFGFGLQDHIKAHSSRLTGILNGVDYDEWSPATDTFIAAQYDVEDMSGKAACRQELQKQFGLPQSEDQPVMGFVGRLAEQKGIALIAEALPGLLNLDARFVFLGTGEKWAESFFSDMAARHPDRLACHVGYSNELAHRIEAGSDLFLMPSLFEPCGLNQIYSLRYGTLPLVRATGGLDDTIDNYDPSAGTGTGFKFRDPHAGALYHTVKWAMDTWRNHPDTFRAMQKRAMLKRFDWKRSAKEYLTVFKKALETRRR